MDRVSVPIAVGKGTQPGPTVFVSASVHGDEYEGIVAIQDYFRELDTESLKGNFIGLPIANPFAFGAQSRESALHTDGLNLARQFPGDVNGSPTQRLAATLFGLVRRLLGSNDLFVDFHSGGTRYEYLTMVGYHPTGDQSEAQSRKMARSFGVPQLWEIPPSPNSTATFNGAIARAGIPAIGTEVRGRGGLLACDVAPLTEGLNRMLVAMQMVGGEIDAQEHAPTVTKPVNCAATGIFKATAEMGEVVREGMALAQIVDPRGDVLETITAPVKGSVWAMRRFGSIRAGEMAYLIGLSSE
jgi:predicted deacylase